MSVDTAWDWIDGSGAPTLPVLAEGPFTRQAPLLATSGNGHTAQPGEPVALSEADIAAAAEIERLTRERRIDHLIREEVERREAKSIVNHREYVEMFGELSDGIQTRDAMRNVPPPVQLIEDVLYTGAVAVFYGDSQSCKTWVAQSLEACASTGKPWPSIEGGVLVAQCRTLYVAAEDGGIISTRLDMWETAHQLRIPNGAPGSGMDILPRGIDMLDPFEIAKLVKLIQERQYRMIVVDTVASSMRGADEGNSEFSLAIYHMKKLVAAMAEHGGGCVVLVHHTGKDGDKGARGGSSLFNDADIVWRFEGDPYRIKMTNEKWKADSKRPVINLRLKLNPVPHIVEMGEEVELDQWIPDENAEMRKGILDYCREHALDNNGQGVGKNSIIGGIREAGIKVRRANAIEILAALVDSGQLITADGPNRTTYHRTPPDPPQQDTLSGGSA